MPLFSRRDFLKTSALAGTVAAWSPWPTSATPPEPPSPLLRADAATRPVSLAEIAVLDDASRLLLYTFEAPPQVVGTLMNRPDVYRIAGMVEADPEEVVDVLAGAAEAESYSAERTAFAMGWLAHRAATARLTTQEEVASDVASEAAVYRDAEILRALSGTPEPSAEADAEAIAGLFNGMWHRALIRLHTIKPDEGDVERWMSGLLDWHTADRDLWHRYAEAVARPDPETRRQHVTDVNFYAPSDRIIGLAETIRQGDLQAGYDIAAAAEAPGQSRYALALADAYGRLRAAAAFLDGNGSRQALLAERG